MNVLFWLASLVILAVIINFVVQGTLFLGWAIGWVLIMILGALVVQEILKMNYFIGLIVAILLLVALAHYFIG